MFGLVPLLQQLGLLIGKRPGTLFVANLVLFLPSLSYFLLFDVKIDTDVRRGFAHPDGRAAKELEAFGEFYNVSMDGLEILLVFLEAKQPNAELALTSQLLAEVDRLDRHIKALSVELGENTAGNAPAVIRLEQLQTGRGDVNFLLHAYKWAHQRQEAQLANGGQLDSQIQLDFPVSRIYGFEVPLGSHFFGVRPNNGSRKASGIQSVRCIALWYMFEGRGPQMREALAQLELRLFELSKTGTFSTHFNMNLYADEIANFEMMRGSKRTIKLLSLGIAAMVAFMLVAFWQYNWKSQLFLISLALLSPMLAISVTFALVGWFGVQFNAIMSIMPFLVFGIGVDNAFLLLHSWRKWTKIEQKQQKTPDIPKRMANVVAEMGPSIAITSITNGLAFGIGTFSASSQMASFCLCTTIAIFLDFLFEFVVFAPCLPLIGWKGDADGEGRSKLHKLRVNFCRSYAKFIVSKWAKICTVCLLSIAYTLAFFGIAQMEATFEPQKTFSGDSPLQKSIGVINRVMVEHAPVSFLVFHPPNISDPVQLERFTQMISQLEALPNTLRIELWLRDYLEYDRRNFNKTLLRNGNFSSAEYRPSYALVPRYLRERMMDDKRIVAFREHEKGNVSVDNFVFVLSRWGELSWHQRAFFVDTLRTIVDTFPEFNVTVFDYDSTIYDLILTVKTEMLKAVMVTLTCMALVCFFVIPNLRNTSIATFSVLSISFTLIGALGWWGLDLDPVTMINVLMAIGFSVDFSAHICYHFNKMQMAARKQKRASSMELPKESDEFVPNGDGSDAQRQIECILNAVGRPMLEAAISTIICAFPLFFLSIYIIAAFARTVLCVGIIGTIHGLFIVPVLLSLQLKTAGCKEDDDISSAASSQQPLVVEVESARLLNEQKKLADDGNIDGNTKI